MTKQTGLALAIIVGIIIMGFFWLQFFGQPAQEPVRTSQIPYGSDTDYQKILISRH